MSEPILQKIRAGGYSGKELENLYANAERLGRSEIQEAAKRALKEIDSRSYSKRFVKPVRDKVEQIVKEIAEAEGWADWKGNDVRNGIKPAGAMMNGEELAAFYFSYRKPPWKSSAYLTVFQKDEESSVMYKVGAHNMKEAIVETSTEAVRLFREAIET